MSGVSAEHLCRGVHLEEIRYQSASMGPGRSTISIFCAHPYVSCSLSLCSCVSHTFPCLAFRRLLCVWAAFLLRSELWYGLLNSLGEVDVMLCRLALLPPAYCDVSAANRTVWRRERVGGVAAAAVRRPRIRGDSDVHNR